MSMRRWRRSNASSPSMPIPSGSCRLGCPTARVAAGRGRCAELEVDAVLELTVEVDAVAVPALATTVNITWSVLLRYAPALSSTVT